MAASQNTLPGVEKSNQLEKLESALEAVLGAYGSAKTFARLSAENPAVSANIVKLAKELTPALRLMQTLG